MNEGAVHSLTRARINITPSYQLRRCISMDIFPSQYVIKISLYWQVKSHYIFYLINLNDVNRASNQLFHGRTAIVSSFHVLVPIPPSSFPPSLRQCDSFGNFQSISTTEKIKFASHRTHLIHRSLNLRPKPKR